MKAVIPLSPDDLGGPSIAVGGDTFEVLARRDKAVLIEFNNVPEAVNWFDSFELMYCQTLHDDSAFKVIRPVADEERKSFRVPLWIQGEDVPQCCDSPMFFVGQIDDDNICMEPPAGAKMWWHDKASFYVFTCPYCLESKVVGQQI
jgi:hypothetical protein